MEKMSVRKAGTFFAAMGLLIFVCAAGILRWQREGDISRAEHPDKVEMVPEGGFYSEDIRVSILAPGDAVIRYTLDCGEPDEADGQIYGSPIQLTAGDEEQVYVIRAKAFYKDGTVSDICTQTYFCGASIKDRYDMPVVSIAGEPEGLFGYEDGILVPGRRYDDYIQENPGAHPGGGVDANYTMRGMKAERQVSIEIYDADGRRLTAQDGGVRVAGELSRLNNHKSLRLYARREYADEESRDNKFRYDFFEDLYSEEDGSMGQAYKRLLLQNSGQDYGYGFVRTELVSKLAQQAGFPDTQHVCAVCVYINGDYYGSYWLSSSFDDQYFENRYGEQDGEFVVLEGGDRKKTPADASDRQEIRRADEFNARYNAFAEMDLTKDENYQALTEFLDVENYLRYFAIENYVGNDDWPDANVKTYRYEAGAGGYGEGVLDGRYRMLLFDADYGFGLLFYYDTVGCLVNEMTLDKIMYEKSPLFASLMEREDCRQYFASYTLDLMNGAMRAENVSAQVDELHASHAAELSRTLAVEGLVGGLLLQEDKLNMDTVEWNVQRIKAFAAERPEYVLQDIAEKFSYEDQYVLTTVSERATSSVRINSLYVSEQEFNGIYLQEIPVVIEPVLGPNDVFVGWRVNGVFREEKSLTLGAGDVRTKDSGDAGIRVELLTEPVDEPVLRIRSVAAGGNQDYVELVNLSDRPLSTKGYYMSDGEDLYQYALPGMTIQPGSSACFVGKGNNSPDSLGQFVMNFDLKEGETLTLTRQRDILDEVVIPDMSKDGVYVKDFRKGKFMEQKRK